MEDDGREWDDVSLLVLLSVTKHKQPAYHRYIEKRNNHWHHLSSLTSNRFRRRLKAAWILTTNLYSIILPRCLLFVIRQSRFCLRAAFGEYWAKERKKYTWISLLDNNASEGMREETLNSMVHESLPNALKYTAMIATLTVRTVDVMCMTRRYDRGQESNVPKHSLYSTTKSKEYSCVRSWRK